MQKTCVLSSQCNIVAGLLYDKVALCIIYYSETLEED